LFSIILLDERVNFALASNIQTNEFISAQMRTIRVDLIEFEAKFS